MVVGLWPHGAYDSNFHCLPSVAPPYFQCKWQYELRSWGLPANFPCCRYLHRHLEKSWVFPQSSSHLPQPSNSQWSSGFPPYQYTYFSLYELIFLNSPLLGKLWAFPKSPALHQASLFFCSGGLFQDIPATGNKQEISPGRHHTDQSGRSLSPACICCSFAPG